jgi:hypothetical protein
MSVYDSFDRCLQCKSAAVAFISSAAILLSAAVAVVAVAATDDEYSGLCY